MEFLVVVTLLVLALGIFSAALPFVAWQQRKQLRRQASRPLEALKTDASFMTMLAAGGPCGRCRQSDHRRSLTMSSRSCLTS
jgi:hypothetical protein